MSAAIRMRLNEPITDAGFSGGGGHWPVVQNTLMVRITQSSSTILIAMLLNSLVGIVLFVSILLFKQGVAGLASWHPRCAGGR